jgi:hypothetical protein
MVSAPRVRLNGVTNGMTTEEHYHRQNREGSHLISSEMGCESRVSEVQKENRLEVRHLVTTPYFQALHHTKQSQQCDTNLHKATNNIHGDDRESSMEFPATKEESSDNAEPEFVGADAT